MQDTQTPWQLMLNQLPNIEAKFADFDNSFWQQQHLPPAVLELCRLRVAQLHQHNSELEPVPFEITKAKKDNLTQWASAGIYDDAEQACIGFTEVYCMDVAAISDSDADAVKAHFGEAGLVALVQALGLFYATTRTAMLNQSLNEATANV